MILHRIEWPLLFEIGYQKPRRVANTHAPLEIACSGALEFFFQTNQAFYLKQGANLLIGEYQDQLPSRVDEQSRGLDDRKINLLTGQPSWAQALWTVGCWVFTGEEEVLTSRPPSWELLSYQC